MKRLIILICIFILNPWALISQTRDQIKLNVKSKVKFIDDMYSYYYTLTNGKGAKQAVWKYEIMLFAKQPINNLEAPLTWNKIYFDGDPPTIEWFAQAEDDVDEFKDEIKPNDSRSGFSFDAIFPPGIIIYYSEGWADFPKFPEGMADDSIPGYDDLTPYGPGVVGKTIGPVLPPEPFNIMAFLDTLLSYTRQSVQLGWLKEKRDDDCDDDEQPNDGIAKNVEKRIEKAKKELMKGDSVKARKELEKLVKKVEKIYIKSEEAEMKKHDNEIVMTSEAYALLKYNTEYLIERLPEKKSKKEK